MKKMRYIVCTSIFLIIIIGNSISAQKNADKEYYLLDSINYSEYTTSDIQIIETALKKYYNSKHDTSRLNALEIITENMMHDDWAKYNLLVKNIAAKALKKEQNSVLKKRYLESLAGAINNMGVIYQQNGDISKAIKFFHKSLKYQEEIDDKYGTSMALNNIGAIYNNQGNIDKALEYLLKSLAIREEIGSKKGIAQSLNNIGAIYYKLTDYPKALSYYKKSLTLYEAIDDKEGTAYSLSNIGNVYDKQNLPYGLSYHLRSLIIREEIGDKKGEAFALYSIGESYLNKGQINEAIKYANKSYTISTQMGYYQNIERSNHLLSRIYKKTKNYKLGWEAYEKFISLRDSTNNEKNKRIALDQDSKYKFEKEQAVRDAEYKKELEIIEEKGQKQKIISFSITGGLILVLIFSFIVVSRLKLTRKQNLIIEEQKQLVDIKNKEILDSITYAKRIQEAILPPVTDLNKYLKNGFVIYKPKDIVAGDFYWLEQKDDIILFAAADCTGHGVPGAMVSVVCNNALNRAVREYHLTRPNEILDKVRELVIETFEKSGQEVKDGMDIALCSLNFSTNLLTFAGANNPVYIVRKDNLIETKGDKQSIGRFAGTKPYHAHNIDLEKGDNIYVFTDGYPDQFGGEKGKKFKYKQLKEVLISIQEHTMNDQQKIIDQTFTRWKGDLEQIDDVLMIGVKI
jgi:serine phosphatase RsbU (regulator of sigma subunit)/tetratricopeptide (TPR) repeat protein